MVDVPFRSSAPLRNDICNTAAELQQRLTRPLPDRATVYMVGAEALYRLYKNLGAGFDNLTSRVIVPADGSLDRWVQESVYGASPWAAIEFANASASVAPVAQFAWTALGSTAGSFALASGDATMFAVDAASSLLTYHGLPRYMTIEWIASLRNGTSAAPIEVHAVASVSNDVPSGDTNGNRAAGEQATDVTDVQTNVITGKRSVLLSDGNTIRLMLRNMTGTQIILVNYFSLSVSPN